MLTEFEDQYIDVLQNIEWALLSLVKEHPELSDHDMLRIIEQALTYYKSQQRGNLAITQSKLTDIRQDIFERIRSMCEWRLLSFYSNEHRNQPRRTWKCASSMFGSR